jgi:5S rRNA maturation endonuclease (ribonuclease M5)
MAKLEQLNLDIKEEGNGNYRMNSPLRPGSNSHAFTVVINDDEHGAFKSYNPNDQPESGSLYELAKLLGIEPEPPDRPEYNTKRTYTGLEEYARAHGLTSPALLTAAGWSQVIQHNRPALKIETATGPRYRFLDDKEPRYWHAKGYRRCWYKLAQALEMGGPLIICNGEASTVAAQAVGLAAIAITSGSEKASIPDNLLDELPGGRKIIVALDCDQAGRKAAPKLAQFLKEHNFQAIAVDMGLGSAGQDLADFCMLHRDAAAAELLKLPPIEPPKEDHREGQIKTAEFISALNLLGYKFRMNVLDDTVEINNEPISDNTAAEIRARMWDAGYTKYHRLMEDAYTMHAARNEYHPIKHYLESLKWDGKPYLNALAMHFVDTQNIFSVWLRKWLVGAIAKVYENYQNPMLILDGAQGKGKSHFSQWLCPKDLGHHFFEGAIQPESNDHKIMLATTWLWEVSELGATTRKADREALKSFITLQWVTARKPYGKRPINKPSLASFIGTVNDEAGFLNDPTGSRRFMSCTLLDIDWEYTKMGVDNIWAEAYHLYKSGFNFRLTAEEKQLQAEINEHYEIEDPWATEILKRYIITNKEDDFMAGATILMAMDKDHLEIKNTMRLSRIMKKFRLEKGKRLMPDGSRPNGFFGLKNREIQRP